MKSRYPIFARITAMTSIAALCLLSACNDELDDNAVPDSFRISPSDVTLSADDGTVVLTVVGGQPPYQWSVADDSLGSVTGDTEIVTYSRTEKNGANTVQVRDSRQWVTSTAITQTDQEQSNIAVSPSSSTLANDGDTLILIATGTEPFTWQLADRNRGRLNTSSGRSTIYTRKSAGNNSVVLHDGKGNAASATISQPAETPETIESLAITANPTTLAANGGLSTITVTGGTPPYTLGIGNSGIGEFTSVAADQASAVYRRTGIGQNSVTVSDAASASASVLITQSSGTTLTASASPSTLSTNGTLSQITVSGGTPPYEWSLASNTLTTNSFGRIVSIASQGSSGVYQRDGAGDNAIIIRDDNNIQYSIIISQP